MNFKEFYYNIFYPRIITEDYESVIKQIKNMINNNGLAPESIDNILDIYNNASVDEGREKAKKDSDLVALTYMYIIGENIGLSVDDIKREYSSYLNSETSVGKKLLSEYVTNLQNEIKSKGLFKPDKKADKLELIKNKTIDLLETIHRYQNKEEFKGSVPNEENDKVYENKDIVIFKADSKSKCIYYGRNSRLCISTKSGNYYWKYRMGKMRKGDDLGMTTYFVYWKNKDGSIDQDKRILVDSLGNENGGADKYSWNPISPNTDKDISKNELISNFPELQKPFDKNIFQFIPYGEKEKRFQWIEENIKNASQLDSYEDYEMWIQTEITLLSSDWEIIEKKTNDKEIRKLLLLAAELGNSIPLNFLEKYFSEKEKERYLNKLAEDPQNSYNYAVYILKGKNVPEIIVNGISKDSYYSYDYARMQSFGKNIPDILIQGIAKDPEYAYQYAKFVLGGVDVPEILVQGVSKDPRFSYLYIANVLKGKNVPEILIQSIIQKSEYSYHYATEILNGQNVPDIIIQGIAKDPDNSYRYAIEVLHGQNVPEILFQSIAKSSLMSYNYATQVLHGQNVPEILFQSIAKSSNYSYDYATLILKGQNVPDILIQGIARDPLYSHLYAKDVLKGQNVPDILIQGIAKDPLASHSYARDVLKGQNVPEILIQSIAESSNYSYFYARNVLKGQNVPEILIKSIAESSNYSYMYARDVLKGQNVPEILIQSIAETVDSAYGYIKFVLGGQNVPEILVKTIAKDSNYSFLYAKNILKGQNVPDIILQAIARDPEYSQQSLTEATLNSLSTNVIRSNSENINSIENRNFSAEYSADASSVIRDSRMDGFIGEGIFDDSNKIAGYGYGYRMGADGEYDELEYIDTNDITFFSDKFKQSVVENGIENICTPENTFYISNLVVDKPYRLYVKPLLNALLNRISSEGYRYIAFDGLSDTIRLFDSTRKASRLSSNKLIKLAEVDGGESKLVLFYIG